MSKLDDMTDEEIRARLGIPIAGRRPTMEERIAAHALRSFPEPHDPEEASTDRSRCRDCGAAGRWLDQNGRCDQCTAFYDGGTP